MNKLHFLPFLRHHLNKKTYNDSLRWVDESNGKFVVEWHKANKSVNPKDLGVMNAWWAYKKGNDGRDRPTDIKNNFRL